MDELVKQALAKWPHVPDCTGWLELDARGRWRIGEASAGPRQPITNAAMIAFINRNYIAADRCWYFQNGPQRVFVELEYTPFVWRLVPLQAGAWTLVTHTGVSAVPWAIWLDDAGRFVIEAKSDGGEHRVGVVHDHDTALIADRLRGETGDALDDDGMAELTTTRTTTRTTSHEIAASNAVATTLVKLHWVTSSSTPLELPLHRIAADAVPARFEFEPRPSMVVRIDVDTRR